MSDGRKDSAPQIFEKVLSDSDTVMGMPVAYYQTHGLFVNCYHKRSEIVLISYENSAFNYH